MKRFRIQLVIAGIVLVCGVSLMGLVYIVFNKPETYITPGIVTSNSPALESPLSNSASVTQQSYPPRATVHYPTKIYKGIKPVAPSAVRGLYLTSGAQVQTVGSGFALNTSSETSQGASASRGVIYSTASAGLPTSNFLALASQRQVAEPESQEAPQMAHLASAEPRRAPGPPNPGDLDPEHQLVEHPIGDGIWCLLLLAIGYAAVKIRRKNRTMTSVMQTRW